MVYTLVSQQITIYNQKKEMKKWNMEVEQVKKENQKLKDEVKMSQDDQYIEKIARERLGLTKKGESTIVDKKK
ncbi:Septum formation initiator superfamily protein [Hathewaya histolytica]|uniref:Septum formation initiator superfamily protein n=1 Tax=Hathewaya histolytica TaxID=1498 RepID=A0A4U9RSQ6_HATHI|nr:Septum formation initiator superfamily protein [Hathewaya histolytica]